MLLKKKTFSFLKCFLLSPGQKDDAEEKETSNKIKLVINLDSSLGPIFVSLASFRHVFFCPIEDDVHHAKIKAYMHCPIKA